MAGEQMGDSNSRLASATIGLAAVLIATVGGGAVFFRSAPLTTLGPVAGAIAALACLTLLDAFLVAAGGTLLGAGLVLATSSLRPATLTGWFAQAALVALVASAVACVLAWMLASAPRYRRLVAALAVAVIVGSGWLFATSLSSSVQPATWVTGVPGTSMPFTRALVTEPAFSADSVDETIYLALVQRLSAGRGYYPTVVSTLAESNRAHPGEPVALNLSLSYRLPTLSWLLSRAPQDGISLVLFALVLQLLATISAFVLAREYVTAPLALAGATCVSTYFATLAIAPSILYSELWAGGLGLVSVALFIASRSRPEKVWPLQTASVLVALTAALFRELAVAFLLVGLVATLADRDCRRAQLWTLWTGGVVVFAGAYALHSRAVFSALAASGIAHPALQSSSTVPWLRPDGLGLVAAVALLGAMVVLRQLAAWSLYLAGLVGAGVAPKDTASWVMLWSVTLGGSVALMVLRPGGETTAGLPPGFWGMVVIPVVIACVPLVFARIEAARQDIITDDDVPGAGTPT